MRARRSRNAGSGDNGAAENPADRYRREVSILIPSAVLDSNAERANRAEPAYCVRLGLAGPMLCDWKRSPAEAWRSTKRRFPARAPAEEVQR
jgi:hypothetical protein